MLPSLKNELLFSGLSLTIAISSIAQFASKNGSMITPKGQVHVLMIFAEVNYPTASKNAGNSLWPQGQFPVNADSLFDPQWTGTPVMEITA